MGYQRIPQNLPAGVYVIVYEPFFMTMIIGRALCSAIRLSRMKLARPRAVQPRSFSPEPCCR